jgi:hypothetical protein
MSLSRIFDRYDANNDAGPVTWADIALANKVDLLLADVAVLKQHVGELQQELQKMREWNGRLLAERRKETASLLNEAGKLQERVSRGEFTRVGLEVSILQIQKRALLA